MVVVVTLRGSFEKSTELILLGIKDCQSKLASHGNAHVLFGTDEWTYNTRLCGAEILRIQIFEIKFQNRKCRPLQTFATIISLAHILMITMGEMWLLPSEGSSNNDAAQSRYLPKLGNGSVAHLTHASRHVGS